MYQQYHEHQPLLRPIQYYFGLLSNLISWIRKCVELGKPDQEKYEGGDRAVSTRY